MNTATDALTAIPVDHRRRLYNSAVHGVIRNERRRLPEQRIPVRADVLDLDWGRLSDRVPADLPEHVECSTRGLEAGGVDHPSVREVADEWGRPWVEGARGVRGGRDADAMVVARPAFAPSGVWAEVML